MNGFVEDTVGLPLYEPPPRFIPPHQRKDHPDYDNNLSDYLMRSIRFKRTNAPLGFLIRGGTEHKCPLFVSKVSEGSSAQRLGMKPGDQILSVNGIDFANITLQEAVDILKQAENIEIRLKFFPYSFEKTYAQE
ncbi:putative PDZ domain-containing protein 11 [Apostichopus japonicus]|uniref:Putative PDZ domain-containing protein 11 n=1 Tax=Stichopus japonicus TaxID=307972 RepID=A0A2G8JBN2_STIJA|nr:putative PDZ domain-containing protein 11 [Apostichopus japonicus]PIK39439.1 putative PDZ domain-containing protein 11 [Apostichopus japonicus]